MHNKITSHVETSEFIAQKVFSDFTLTSTVIPKLGHGVYIENANASTLDSCVK